MSTKKTSSGTTRLPQDNLEEINGIGPKAMEALNRIGVTSFAALVEFETAEQLSKELFERASYSVSSRVIERDDWLGQAKAKDAKSDESNWQPQSEFTVFIEQLKSLPREELASWRVRVYEGDHGESEKFAFEEGQWGEWIGWILDRTNAPPTIRRPMQEAKASQSEVQPPTGYAVLMEERERNMDKITLKRGNEDITLEKVPDTFAIRLRRGRATDVESLESTVGRSPAEIQHSEHLPTEGMDLFVVKDARELESTMEVMRQSQSTDVVSHVYRLGDSPDSLFVPGDTLTVSFRPDTPKEVREDILAEYGLEIVEDVTFMQDAYTVRLTDSSTENPLKIAAKLQKRPEILVAEPELSFKAMLHLLPTDPEFRKQWHLRNRGDLVGLKEGADVRAEGAWEYTKGKREIKICIIDDGFELEHPEFNAEEKVIAPRDFAQNDIDPRPELNESHGTACAGVALAEENGIGVVGIAPRCSLIPVRMSRWLSDEMVVNYFQHAMNSEADVISCSWSAADWYSPLSSKIDAILRYAATRGRHGKGCVIVFAAGNENRPLRGRKDGKLSLQGFAVHPEVIAVAASNSRDERSSYSNFGHEVSVCAPSSGTPGRGIVTTDLLGPRGRSAGDYCSDFGGTSSATPLVAGVAALILSVNPSLSAQQVKELLQSTADQIDQANGQYDDRGHSESFGYGRVNATRAVKEALELKKPGIPEEPAPVPGLAITINEVEIVSLSTDPGLSAELAATVSFAVSGSRATELVASEAACMLEILVAEEETSSTTKRVAAKQSFLSSVEQSESIDFSFSRAPGLYLVTTFVKLVDANIQAKFVGPRLRVRVAENTALPQVEERSLELA